MSDFCECITNNVAVPPGSLKATEGSETPCSLWLSNTANYPKQFPTASSQSEFSFSWILIGLSIAMFVNITSNYTNESS